MQSLFSVAIWMLVVAQLPPTLPPPESEGWPMPAFTLAITTHRAGLTLRAQDMADELWRERDLESGLWVNSTGVVDTVNPFLAVLLYELLGQHERAEMISELVIARARVIAETTGQAYNGYWYAAMPALIVGDSPPLDLMEKAAPGFLGSYRPNQAPSDHGRFYADGTAAFWCALGGPQPSLYRSSWCAEGAETECLSFYLWADGKRYWPLLTRPYSFWNDHVLFYAFPGLGLGKDTEG